MAKSTKSPTLEIYHIKALMPHRDEGIQLTSEESPYRIIAARPSMSLYEFGTVVLDAFDFVCDHSFGFFDNIKQHYLSKVSYEHPELIEDDWDDFGTSKSDKQVYNINNYSIADIFTKGNKKWSMLFDYGDEWIFWLSLEKKAEMAQGEEFPKIIESKYDAPEQYPDFE